jgi:hypothetical protein
MLYVASDLDYISKELFEINYDKAVEIIKQISNFKKYLKNYVLKENINKIKVFLINIMNI